MQQGLPAKTGASDSEFRPSVADTAIRYCDVADCGWQRLRRAALALVAVQTWQSRLLRSERCSVFSSQAAYM